MKASFILQSKSFATLALLLAMLMSISTKLLADNILPLCFTARNESVTVRFDIKNVTHTIQYSIDSINWITYTSNTNISLSTDQTIYFRAASNQTEATAFGISNEGNCSRFYFSSSNSGRIEASGNIMSLYGPDCPNLPLNDHAFTQLFSNCTLLISMPELTATNLAPYCYSNMFSGCSSLITTNKLPATTLAAFCYYGMFWGCTSLTTPPQLPALTLATRCYSCMFYDCCSLQNTPELPATVLAEGCYGRMFYGCSSLTVVPELPATILPNSCYGEMFKNCSSLAVNGYGPGRKWQINATSIGGYSLSDMFDGTRCGSNLIIGAIYYNSSDTSVYGDLLCLTAKNGNVAIWLDLHNLVASNIKYSTDKMLWYSCSNTTQISLRPDEKVYFCADSNQTTATAFGQNDTLNSSRFHFYSSDNGTIEASGNIMSLYGPNCPNLQLSPSAFEYMFYGCSLLTSTPLLPATNLSNQCYKDMFKDCTSITTAPSLPAQVLADSCYCGMFSGCTSLTSVPSFTATILAKHCYESMFDSCCSLTAPPSLPATILAKNCYRSMFENCTHLLTAPVLPAISLVDSCYFSMFNNCISLTTPPILPATTLANNCYRDMFIRCTSLETTPILPAMTLANNCYRGIFAYCTSLRIPPTLPATSLANNCYRDMFTGCTALSSVPSLPAVTLADSCYMAMFNGCTSLTSPPILPATTLTKNCYHDMFKNCSALITPPALPATNLADECYSYMFLGCSSLTIPPSLPATTLSIGCYHDMFKYCSDLIVAPVLPATNLAEHCYERMFYYCTSLSSLPSLPATVLVPYCYYRMFWGSNSLIINTSGSGKRWKITASTAPEGALSSMFNGTSGSMNGTPSINTSYRIASTIYYNIALSTNDTTAGIASGSGSYEIGQTATITATPKPHHHFVKWSNGDTTRSFTITIFNDTILSAIFATDKHNIMASGINCQVSGSGNYDYGSIATLTAIGNPHYHFVRWSDGDTVNPRSLAVQKDTTLSALFEIDKHTITVSSSSNGTVAGNGEYDYGSTTNITATPNLHYHFSRWSDGNTSNPRTITVIEDKTYTAIFEGDLHTITANGKNGSVSGAGTYHYDSTATLSATADDHYHFIGWTDGDTSNPRTVNVNGDATYTALFEIDRHTISDSCINGSVIGIGEYDYGTTVTVTVIPDIHYSFISWLDGDTSESITFVLTGDTVVSAVFDLTPYSISATCEHGEVNGNGTYQYPDIVTLTVMPDDGYKFVEWSDGNEYNPRIFKAEEDLELEAICEAIPAVGLENVEDEILFYCIDKIIYNPNNEPLKVYSIEGKLIKESDDNIEMYCWPSGVYVVVDSKGRSDKIVI